MNRHSINIATHSVKISLSWLEWGSRSSQRTVVCVHGLTRNAHDFEVLADYLATQGMRVLALDVAGRGDSDWLADKSSYTVPTYVDHIIAWSQALGLERLDWIGTSMGGLIGMAIATREEIVLRSMILNDIGPFIPAEALSDIATYVGKELTGFTSLNEAVDYARSTHEGFGQLSETEWKILGEKAVRQREDGLYYLKYDPAIRNAMQIMQGQDVELWPLYEQITCPVMVVRGQNSKLLRADTADEMTRRGPAATLHVVKDTGHAPALMAEDQCQALLNWLEKH